MHKIRHLLSSAFLLAFILSPAYANQYPIDESLQKGLPLVVPQEFQEGSASEDNIKRWVSSLSSNIPSQLKYMNLDKDKKDEILAELPHARGATGNSSYLVFTKEKKGYRFIGELSFASIRAITYPDSPISYLLTTGHISAMETSVSLQLLKEKKISSPYGIKETLVKDGIVVEPRDNNLFHKLFEEAIPEQELRSLFNIEDK